MLTIVGIILIAISVMGCSLCRVTAIREAEELIARGYDAKVCTYDMTLPGRAYGGFIWTHHAQACYWKDGKMFWAGAFGASENPTFGVKRILVQWDVSEYKRKVQP